MNLDLESAHHLLGRCGFGPEPAAIEAAVGRRAEAVVDELLAGLGAEPVTPPPDWVDQPPPSPWERRTNRDEVRQRQLERGQELKAWWFGELVATPSPLTERLVLLWHGHFTTAFREVRAPTLLYRQNALFRQHAAGSFRELLHAVARDPAMLVYLDTARSTRAHPNENFARELLELFTLGEGHYTEDDIRDIARAFTGYTIDRWTGQFRFARRRHDGGLKTVLGATGRFDGDDVLDVILEQPRAARHVAGVVWRAFASGEPDEWPGDEEIDRFAAVFRDSDYAIDALVRAVLTSDAFFATGSGPARGRIKSPVELIVGTCRLFDLAPDDLSQLARLSQRLGQDLFDPPTVKGWPGGSAWISSSTLVERVRLLRQVAESDELARALRGGLSAWLGRADLDPREARELTERVLLPVEPVAAQSLMGGAVEVVARLLTDPTYQLI